MRKVARFLSYLHESEGSGGIDSTEPALLQNTKFSDFSRSMQAAKAQARLCIGINSTEPSLLENAIRTKFSVFSLSNKCKQRIIALARLHIIKSLHESS